MESSRYVTRIIEAFSERGTESALKWSGGELGYAELLGAVWRTARTLRALGLKRGDGLISLTGNTPEAISTRLACHVLGVRHVAVQLGPATEGLVHIFTDADAAAVVVDPRCEPPGGAQPRLADAGLILSFGPAPGALDLTALSAAQPDLPLPIAAHEDDIASLCYTSGTTGPPKGVAVTFAALAVASESTDRLAAHLGLPDGLRFAACTPIAYAAGDLVLDLLRLGVSVELFAEFDADRVWEAIGRGGPVVTFLYPSQLTQLADHPAAATQARENLLLMIYGSAPVSPHRLAHAITTLGCAFLQGYAQTEVTSVTMLTPEDHLAGVSGRPELLSSVGRALPGVELRIEEQTGEILVRSGSAMAGYWRRPDLTAAVLRDGWLHTGDVGRIDADGYLYLVDRLRDMIIVNGRNCPALPIEAALTTHPAVRQAAVVGAPSDDTGEAVHAFVVVAPGTQVSPAELKALVRSAVGPYQEPSQVRFVDHIPVSPLGKPDKKALRARCA